MWRDVPRALLDPPIIFTHKPCNITLPKKFSYFLIAGQQRDWELGNYLCDAWVATDVMGCTASILNLAAISVDR